MCMNKRKINVLTKKDIYNHPKGSLQIDTISKDGFSSLLTVLSTEISSIVGKNKTENPYLVNKRQKDVIECCINIGKEILMNTKKIDRDVLASMMHDFIDNFNNIINPIETEEIINKIFQGFCIGK